MKCVLQGLLPKVAKMKSRLPGLLPRVAKMKRRLPGLLPRVAKTPGRAKKRIEKEPPKRTALEIP